MNQQTKLWASVAGVSIACAAAIGGSLAAATHSTPPPVEKPAGNVQPATVTVTASPSVSLTTVAAVKVSPSTVKPAAPKQRAIVQQGAAVTDPTTTAPAPADSTTQPPPVDLGTGTTDAGGVRRAPAPPEVTKARPSHPNEQAPPPLQPSPTGSG